MGGREETENRQRNLLCYGKGNVTRSSDSLQQYRKTVGQQAAMAYQPQQHNEQLRQQRGIKRGQQLSPANTLSPKRLCLVVQVSPDSRRQLQQQPLFPHWTIFVLKYLSTKWQRNNDLFIPKNLRNLKEP